MNKTFIDETHRSADDKRIASITDFPRWGYDKERVRIELTRERGRRHGPSTTTRSSTRVPTLTAARTIAKAFVK